MTEREELIRRLERVKALAERGVGGEKENAEALLNRLMQKYGITNDDIEDTLERDFFIRYHSAWEEKLIYQISYMHLGRGHCSGTIGTYTRRPRKMVCVTCTPAQYIEIEADFEFYKVAWEEELAIFYSAFISKNTIEVYPITVGSDYTIRDYKITVTETDDPAEIQLVVLGQAEGLIFVD